MAAVPSPPNADCSCDNTKVSHVTPWRKLAERLLSSLVQDRSVDDWLHVQPTKICLTHHNVTADIGIVWATQGSRNVGSMQEDRQGTDLEDVVRFASLLPIDRHRKNTIINVFHHVPIIVVWEETFFVLSSCYLCVEIHLMEFSSSAENSIHKGFHRTSNRV
jgi:hypothetical protein